MITQTDVRVKTYRKEMNRVESGGSAQQNDSYRHTVFKPKSEFASRASVATDALDGEIPIPLGQRFTLVAALRALRKSSGTAYCRAGIAAKRRKGRGPLPERSDGKPP